MKFIIKRTSDCFDENKGRKPADGCKQEKINDMGKIGWTLILNTLDDLFALKESCKEEIIFCSFRPWMGELYPVLEIYDYHRE